MKPIKVLAFTFSKSLPDKVYVTKMENFRTSYYWVSYPSAKDTLSSSSLSSTSHTNCTDFVDSISLSIPIIHHSAEGPLPFCSTGQRRHCRTEKKKDIRGSAPKVRLEVFYCWIEERKARQGQKRWWMERHCGTGLKIMLVTFLPPTPLALSFLFPFKSAAAADDDDDDDDLNSAHCQCSYRYSLVNDLM